MAFIPGEKMVHDQAVFGNRAIYALTADNILRVGAYDSAGVAKRLDLELYGSASTKKWVLDASADTITVTNLSMVTAAGTAPTAVTTATGTAAPAMRTETGTVGGGTTIATTGTGGVGGGIALTLGAGGVATAAATSATGGAGGAYVITTGAGGAEAVATVTGTGGAGGAYTITTGAGGAVSAAVSGTATGGASGALAFASGVGGAVTATTGTNVGGASGAVSLVSGTGGAASGATDTGGASGDVTVGSGTGGAGDTGGASGNTIIQTGAVGAGGSPVAGHVIIKPAVTEKWRYTASGVHTSLGATPTNVNIDGVTLAEGGFAITDVRNALIDDASGGSGTVTHYIGNQSITTSSDSRLKIGIEPTKRDCEAIVNALKPVDFTWDDPSDRNEWGKNSRGRYTGFIAQEMIGVAPWAVNAGSSAKCPACLAGNTCDEHPGQFMTAEYQYLVPVLVKVAQGLLGRVAALEAKLAKVA